MKVQHRWKALRDQLVGPAAMDAGLSGEEIDRLLAFDPLEEEFRKLELEVLQRDCRHPRTVELHEMGGRSYTICTACGKREELALECAPKCAPAMANHRSASEH